MSLQALAVQYRTQADALRGRIRQIQGEQKNANAAEAAQLESRLRCLTEMWREACDIAVLLERYYERGYRRNGRYTL